MISVNPRRMDYKSSCDLQVGGYLQQLESCAYVILDNERKREHGDTTEHSLS